MFCWLVERMLIFWTGRDSFVPTTPFVKRNKSNTREFELAIELVVLVYTQVNNVVMYIKGQ